MKKYVLIRIYMYLYGMRNKRGEADKVQKITITLSNEAKAILDQQLNKSGFINRLIINSETNEVAQPVKVISKPTLTSKQPIVKKAVKPAVDREPTMAELLKAANKAN